MRDYFIGQVINIDPKKTDPNFAISILGEMLYDVMRHTAGPEYKGRIRVKSVNRTTRTITVEWEEPDVRSRPS